MRSVAIALFIFLLLFLAASSGAQTLPVGTPVLEESWRRLQLKGKLDGDHSFMVRPLFSSGGLNYDSLQNPEGDLPGPGIKNTVSYARGKGVLRLLPVTLKQQYNTHHPYGWNDGAMIPARGYQALASAGVYTKIGPLSIQLQPEMVYAQNRDFFTFPTTEDEKVWGTYYESVLNWIDQPEKFGEGSYKKIFPGNSSVRVHFRKLSLGVSTENLWWGPGYRNSLIMSNNAPGFPHLTFNTTAPVASPVGSFEWQLISGYLRGSGILPPDTGRIYEGERLYAPKQADKRYLNGAIITWQPKWTKGLHLGFSRMFYIYESDLQKNVGGYLPIILKYFKANTPEEDNLRRDQLLSGFFRLVIPRVQAEIYAEYGRNDHSLNLRDMLLEPEHTRAYILGGRKIVNRGNKADVELTAEFTNMQSSSTKFLREQSGWYTHYQVRHGYTNLGQIMGAGIGSGSNSQTFRVNWIRGINEFGVGLERIVRNNDFYYDAYAAINDYRGHWMDLSLNVHKTLRHKRFLYSANVAAIKSFNYQWQLKKDVFNVHGSLSASYLF